MEIDDLKTAKSPFHLLAKPMGPICNLDCVYCFYLEKKALFPDTSSFRMNDEALDHFTRQYIQSQPPAMTEVSFAWQGGEPTLLGVEFFQRALEFQQKYAREGMAIANTIQTNGTLLNDAWGQFLHENEFLVGLSVDGPQDLHDVYRRDNRGEGSFDNAMRGLEILKRHKVEFNTLTVVNDENSSHPERVYTFLKEMGSTFFQFIPLVEPDSGPFPVGETRGVTSRSVLPEQYGRFLTGLFDCWLAQDGVGRIFVRDFDTLLALVMGYPSPLCVHAETCGRAAAIEHNGGVYSCDHFVTHKDRLGSVLTQDLATMLDGAKQRRFGQDKQDTLPRRCQKCQYLRYCNGGCPKDRIFHTAGAEPGLNYLCPGYKIFYAHTLPVFQKMAQCLRAGRPASDYKEIEERPNTPPPNHVPPANAGKAPRPNDPCPCGSGRKYKKCCMNQ